MSDQNTRQDTTDEPTRGIQDDTGTQKGGQSSDQDDFGTGYTPTTDDDLSE